MLMTQYVCLQSGVCVQLQEDSSQPYVLLLRSMWYERLADAMHAGNPAHVQQPASPWCSHCGGGPQQPAALC